MNVVGGTQPTRERRIERRITVHLPIHVRGTDLAGEEFEEKTASENVCRRGAAFALRRDLVPGTNLEIRIPAPGKASDPAADFSTRGRVVHIAPGRSARERIIGVEFVGPRFHRVFVPETTA